jgi:hypothetical protein
MAKPRKPKALKMPKKPKLSASLKAKQNYLDRRKKVEDENEAREKKYKSDLKKYEDITKKIAAL